MNQRLRPDDWSGPFGPGALGISAFSEVLTGWTQGGPIDPRDEPAVVDRPRRVQRLHPGPNRTLERLFAAAPAGTPVLVRA